MKPNLGVPRPRHLMSLATSIYTKTNNESRSASTYLIVRFALYYLALARRAVTGWRQTNPVDPLRLNVRPSLAG